MSGMLIWAEIKNGKIRKSSLEAIHAARQAAGESDQVSAVLIGDSVPVDQLINYPIQTIYVVEDQLYRTYQSEPFTDAISLAVEESGADTVIMGATALGRDLSARLAARLNAALATDVVAIDSSKGLVVTKPAYSGKVVSQIELLSPKSVISIRPNLFNPAEPAGEQARIQTLTPVTPTVRAIVKEAVAAAQDMIDITEADIIISGGRGVGGADGFKILEETARAVGGSVGASRTAVDEGWIPYKHQVGQTGKVVSPVLYIACGISGAIQHFAGMGSAKFIIAINTDSEAPIMKKADFAIVGDLFKVLPALRSELLKIIRK